MMLFFFTFLVVLLDFNFRSAAVPGEAVSPLHRGEFERRETSEKCPDTAHQLNKLIVEFENIGGELKEATATMNQMASRTEQLTRGLQLHEERLSLHDRHLKKITAKVCPPGFDYLSEIKGCFKVVFQTLNWSTAGEVCRKVTPGAHLAAITSAAEQDAVKRYLQKEFNKGESSACLGTYGKGVGKSAWLAGQNPIPGRCDTTFVWKTHPGVEFPFVYTSWYSGEPNGCKSQENCIHIVQWLQYNWNDVICDSECCALCEF